MIKILLTLALLSLVGCDDGNTDGTPPGVGGNTEGTPPGAVISSRDYYDINLSFPGADGDVIVVDMQNLSHEDRAEVVHAISDLAGNVGTTGNGGLTGGTTGNGVLDSGNPR